MAHRMVATDGDQPVFAPNLHWHYRYKQRINNKNNKNSTDLVFFAAKSLAFVVL